MTASNYSSLANSNLFTLALLNHTFYILYSRQIIGYGQSGFDPRPLSYRYTVLVLVSVIDGSIDRIKHRRYDTDRSEQYNHRV